MANGLDQASASDHAIIVVQAPKDFYSLAEAAATLGVSSELLRREAKLGRVPARQIGDRWVFSRDALIRWLDNGAAAD